MEEYNYNETIDFSIETIEQADKWFLLQEIPTLIDRENLIMKLDYISFEFELSREEIIYRAMLYRDYLSRNPL